jgi:hypothetical protein
MTASAILAVPWHPSASVAVTVIGNDPACVGVPEKDPRAARTTPAGSAPVSVNLYGAVAPVAVSEALYGWPIVAFGRDVGEIEIGEQIAPLSENAALKVGAGAPPTMSVPTRSQSGSSPALRIQACRSVVPVGNG